MFYYLIVVCVSLKLYVKQWIIIFYIHLSTLMDIRTNKSPYFFQFLPVLRHSSLILCFFINFLLITPLVYQVFLGLLHDLFLQPFASCTHLIKLVSSILFIWPYNLIWPPFIIYCIHFQFLPVYIIPYFIHFCFYFTSFP